MQTKGFKTSLSSSAPFFELVDYRFKFNLFLLKNLPAAFFSGVKLISVTEDSSIVSIPYKWFTRNPFHSTYFACLSMAAEMSTGILAMANVYQRSPKISMLVTAIEGRFYKKAIAPIHFICNEGLTIKKAIEASITEKKPQSIRVASLGFNEQKESVADFWITWSFKVKE